MFCLLSTTSSTASSCDTEFTKEDEQRLKDYIQQLRNDRAAVKLTMLELESIHIDPLSYDVKPRGDSQRLDLENAVLMQELMAMKVSVAGGATFHFHALEKEMATHSSVLAWRIPGTGESGGLPSMGSHRVGHD